MSQIIPQSDPSCPNVRFYGHSAFQLVFDRDDIGAGDRFYDDPRAYQGTWEEALAFVRVSLLVIEANRGTFGQVRFVLERYDATAKSWSRSGEYVFTQRDIKRMVTLLH